MKMPLGIIQGLQSQITTCTYSVSKVRIKTNFNCNLPPNTISSKHYLNVKNVKTLIFRCSYIIQGPRKSEPSLKYVPENRDLEKGVWDLTAKYVCKQLLPSKQYYIIPSNIFLGMGRAYSDPYHGPWSLYIKVHISRVTNYANEMLITSDG